MNNQSETYQQQPPRTQLRRLRAVRRKRRSLREWVLHLLAVDEVRPVQRLTMPNWLCGRGIAFYFLALIVVNSGTNLLRLKFHEQENGKSYEGIHPEKIK